MTGSRVTTGAPEELNRILEEIYQELADLERRIIALEAKA